MKKLLSMLLLSATLWTCGEDEPEKNKELISVAFTIGDNDYQATKNDKTYSVKLPTGVPLTNLTPSVIVSEGADYKPKGSKDFSNPEGIEYTVTAEDGSTEVYLVKVSREPNSEKEITSITFKIGDNNHKATKNDKTYSVELPANVDLKNLPTPDVKVSKDANYEPKNHTDFSKGITYTVTAENGSKEQYTLEVSREPNSEKEITSITFTIEGRDYVANKDNKKTYSIKLPTDVDLKNLPTPDVKVSKGANYEPKKHTDFSKLVKYTVTAENGSKEQYNLKVSRELRSEKEITSVTFNIEGITYSATKNDKTFSVELPAGVSLTKLTPTVIVSEGADYKPKGAKNFSKPVKYTVTAENGDIQPYTLEVSREPSSEKEITSITFKIDDKTYKATKNDKTFSVELPSNVDLNNLPTPDVKVSKGANYEPKKHTNFSKGVKYTVTAEDKTTQPYTLEVSRELRSEKEITSVTFNIEGITYSATKNDKTFSVELPAGVSLTKLTPTVIVSEGADYKPKGAKNFSKPVKYTVTAEDKTTQPYTLEVSRKPSSEKEITSITFNIEGITYKATKNDKTFSVQLPATVDLNNLTTPKVVVSKGANHNLPKNQTNFSKTVTIIVTAENETTQNYTLEVSQERSFKSVWKTTEANERITLPIHEGGTYDFTVNWGDGTETQEVNSHDDEHREHTYTQAATYTVTITGTLVGFNFNQVPDSKNHIIEVKEWGELAFWGELTEKEVAEINEDPEGSKHSDKFGYFKECTNLKSFATTDGPDLSNTNNLMFLFAECNNFNSNISHWDTQDIKYMSGMFNGAEAFNNGGKSLTFKTASVTNMSSMFTSATAFNQDISEWNVTKVTDMSNMFSHTETFNQNISDWNTAKVTNMDGMFNGAKAFNNGGESLKFKTVEVTNMKSMFKGAVVFNQNINEWDTGKVTNMNYMFGETKAFDQDISKWNTAKVTKMNGMFKKATAFNQNISGWCVSKVKKIPPSFDEDGHENFTDNTGRQPKWGGACQQ